MMGGPFQPPAQGGAPAVTPLTPPIGQSQPATAALGQELIKAIQNLAVVTKANLGNQATGDLQGAYPGPISVIATHLAAPLPVSQGGTGNTTGAPSGPAGGDLSGSFPNPEVTGLHLSSPIGVSMGGTGLTSGTSGGILAFSAAGALVSSGLLAQNELVFGGGAGVAPSTPLGLGTSNTLLHGNALGLPSWSGVATGDIINSAVTYGKIQNETAATLLGNPTGSPAAPSEISLGSTLAFSGTALRTAAITGDVTASANSFATSVGAISGQSVSPNTWTPVDASGAGLSFTGVSAGYTRLGNMVLAYTQLTYPSTANTSAAKIGGLPFNVANANYAKAPAAVYVGGGSNAVLLIGLPNTNTAAFFNGVGGAGITNANLSGLNIIFILTYPVA